MRLFASAGRFSAETFTDGYPRWTSITHDGKEIARVHHSELRDINYVVDRIRIAIRASLPDRDKHEVD